MSDRDLAQQLRDEADKLEAGIRRNSAPLLREAAVAVEALAELRAACMHLPRSEPRHWSIKRVLELASDVSR